MTPWPSLPKAVRERVIAELRLQHRGFTALAGEYAAMGEDWAETAKSDREMADALGAALAVLRDAGGDE